jgi:DNA-binding CsgD family transcriptional regulator
MSALSAAHYREMLDLTVQVLDEPSSITDVRSLIAGTLARVLHGDVAVIQETTLTGVAIPQTEVKACSHDWMWQPSDNPQYGRLAATHPLAVHYVRTCDVVPRTVDEVIDSREWRRSVVYLASRAEFDITRHLYIPLAAPTGVSRTLAVGRSGRDFGERDRDAAKELQPLLDCLERQLARRKAPIADRAVLTARERTVVALLGDGLSNAMIARHMGISLHTVTKHQENIYRKMGTHDRLTTVLRAQQSGILD